MLQDGASTGLDGHEDTVRGNVARRLPLSILPSLHNFPKMNNKRALGSPGNCPCKKLFLMKLSPKFYVFTYEARAKLYVAEEYHDC
jgi:hypothetical protein